MLLDVYSHMIAGHEVNVAESADMASLLMRKASLADLEVLLNSDSGSAMRGLTMLATLKKLGIMLSIGRPCVSNDNAYAKSLLGTSKHRPNYPSIPFSRID
jgi:transposase InsO family protein